MAHLVLRIPKKTCPDVQQFLIFFMERTRSFEKSFVETGSANSQKNRREPSNTGVDLWNLGPYGDGKALLLLHSP
jgi:hypothetical protein